MYRSKGASFPFWKVILLPILILLSPHAVGQVDPDIGTYAGEYANKISAAQEMEALDENLFGDTINHYTGLTEFSVTDVSLPGNSALPVAFARRHQFARWAAPGQNGPRPVWMLGPLSDWDIDLPYLHGKFPLSPQYGPSVGWQTSTAGMRCSQPSKNQAAPALNSSSGYIPEDFWSGNILYFPGKGNQELIFVETAAQQKAQGSYTYRWATKDGWYLSCLPTTANGVEGEAFLAHAPDGTRYWFNQFSGTVRSGEAANKRDGLRSGEVRILLTRVEDRFGNYVVYEYAADSDAKLLSITANDGRRLTMTYVGSHIKTVSDGARTWTYTYGDWIAGLVNDETGFLWHVQQPDGTKWSYTTVYAPGVVEVDSTQCGVASTWLANIDMIFQATHPSGAQGKFVFNMRRHGRTHVPKACKKYTIAPFLVKEYVPLNFATVSLSRKEISGPAMSTRVWQWSYQQIAGQYDFDCVGGSCPTSKTVTLSKPDGSLVRSAYGIHYGVNDGLLLSSEQIDADGVTVRSRQDNTYQLSPVGQNYGDGFGSNFRQYADPRAVYQQPKIKTLVSQDGETYEWRVPMCSAVRCFDDLVRPTRAERVSSLGYSRSDSIEYHDDRVSWITGQVSRRINLDTGVVEFEAGFNPQALPVSIKKFGKFQQFATYNPDGTISTFADGKNNVTTLSDWKRGIPQFIRHPATPEAPAGATESAVVNDSGWITSATDENGYTHGYGYDVMGSLASIVYPSNDNVAWLPKGFEFRPVTASDWLPSGISVGQWRHYEGQGNYAKFTYFNALWQPVLVQEYDTSNVAATIRYTRTSYDNDGRTSFKSYPVGDPINATTGVRSFYDALDRVIRTEQDSEQGVLTTTTEFLAGLQVRVTNPRNLSTTTGFMAWDQPGYDLPLWSSQPEGKVVEISRHPHFGWPLQLKQRSADNSVQASRQYVYDGHAQLCKTIEPETGASVMGYDAAGNLESQVSGLPVSSFNSTTDCQHTAAVGTGLSVMRTYDARNRLTHLAFPGGLGNQIWTYEKDNLPASVTAYNGTGHTLPVVTAYTYNKRRLLTGETLAQPGWYSWGTGYYYDAIGNLTNRINSTSGLNIDFAPNALGQPTKAGVYASNAQYFPNGALKQFTYGNGIIHTMTQNARQLPARVTSAGNVLDFTYDYDKNGNPTTILDLVTGTPTAQHRWMSYDGLDRLTTSASAMYGGSDHTHRFTYDALDNIESWKHASVKDYADYVYDQQNRLTSIRNTAGATVVGIGYDAQGNVDNKNGQTYEFDYGNRLRGVTGKEHYRYDGLGRRVMSWKLADGATTLSQYSQAGQILFSWDNLPTEKIHEFVYLAGSLIATIDHAWPSNAVIATKYQHTDALGSPVAVTNEAGAVIERNNYEPYGAIIGNPTRSGIGYTGHVMDGETGLTYMQQRYYDQSIGRFLSIDPVTANNRNGANFNRYWYANSSPYRFIDPDGRQSREPLRSCHDTGTCISLKDWDNGLGREILGAEGRKIMIVVGAPAAAGAGSAVVVTATPAVAAAAQTQGVRYFLCALLSMSACDVRNPARIENVPSRRHTETVSNLRERVRKIEEKNTKKKDKPPPPPPPKGGKLGSK